MGGWSILPRKSDRVNGKLLRSCIAESFGTFSVVFWGTGAAIESNVALGFGIATAVTAYIFHDISGAHFNPAVSLAMFVAQRISLVRCLLYWAMQLLGAVLGAAILLLVNGTVVGAVDLRKEAGVIEEVPDWAGFIAELIGSFTIIFTYLAATNTERRQRVSSYDFPLAVGLAVYVVHLTLHPLTGAGVNPARALMVNAVNKEVRHSIWVYIVGPLIASLVGALSYELIFSYPLKEWLDEKIEMDAAGRRQHSPPKELQIIDSNTQDVVVENPVTKVNGDFAYE
ncbi:hypothetical protein ACHWQZ_G001335 [Mnemiopsis leidyi]